MLLLSNFFVGLKKNICNICKLVLYVPHSVHLSINIPSAFIYNKDVLKKKKDLISSVYFPLLFAITIYCVLVL